MNIKVLGPGCMNCKTLLDRTNQALKDLGREAEVEYITDMDRILGFVALTPGLVVDGNVVHQGKPLPTVEKIKDLLGRAR